MTSSAPQLLERIVAELRRTAGPRSTADLARRFLGLGIVDEELAERLLAPTLDADGRLTRTEHGWVLRESAPKASDPALDAPAVAVFAPFAPLPVPVAAVTAVDGAAFSVAAGGETEVARAEQRLGLLLPRPVVELARACRLLRGYRGAEDPVRLAEALGAAHVEAEDPSACAASAGAAWARLADDLRLEGLSTVGDLVALLDARLERADFGAAEFGPDDLAALTSGPGVYMFRDARRRALYVGQSQSLAARVTSYFVGPPRDGKDRVLRREARRLETKAVETAPDALLLEARWIRRFRPRLNTRIAVHGGATEDGILALHGSGEKNRFVLFVLRSGGLVRRVAAARGPVRRQAAIRDAVGALFRTGTLELDREAGALVASWLRIHPGAAFLRPAIDGGPDDLAARLESFVQETRES